MTEQRKKESCLLERANERSRIDRRLERSRKYIQPWLEDSLNFAGRTQIFGHTEALAWPGRRAVVGVSLYAWE